MKIIASFCLLSVLLFGCNTTTSPTTGQSAGTMIATKNGTSWSSGVPPLVAGTTATRTNSGEVIVTGVATDVSEITLEIMHPGLRTDTLVISGDVAAYSQGILDTSTAWVSIPTLTNPLPGTITITQFDTVKKQISGQFHFVGRRSHQLSDTVNITSGSFFQVSWD